MSEEDGLGVTGTKAFTEDIITLGRKLMETDHFPTSNFFREMFMKPSTKAKSVVDDISWTKRQLVRDRNLTDLDIIELRQDIDCLEWEDIEAKQRFKKLEI